MSADAEGISMQEAARRAVREFVARSDHRDRVARAAHYEVYDLVIDVAASQPTVDTIAERLRQLAT